MIKQWVNDYNNGLGYEEIGKKYGKSSSIIRKKLIGHVVSRPAKRNPVVYEQIPWTTKNERDKLIIRLYQNGDGAHVVSKKLDIGKRTVFRILKANNIETDKTRTYTKLDPIEVNKLYESEMSCSDIAKKLKVSNEAIRYHINNPHNSSDALSIIPHHKQDEILNLYTKDKWSSYRIAEEFGWPYQSVQCFLRRKGVSVGSGTQSWKEAVQRGIKEGGSSLEKQLEQILIDMDIEYETQYQIEEFRYDFGLDNGNILVEVQGSYWHTKPQRRQRDQYKTKLARRHNKKLVIVWDHELARTEFVKNRILCAISPSEFDFRHCKVEPCEWRVSSELLLKYHYQGAGRAGICYALVNGDNPVGTIVFTRPTRQEIATKQGVNYDEIYELTRLVIHPKYQAKNMASWFISRAIKLLRKQHPTTKKLVSFADQTFGHNGTVYRASNWKFDGEVPASYWYYHRRKNEIYHKKSIWDKAKKQGISEKEYAKQKHLLKVNGRNKLRFTLNLKN